MGKDYRVDADNGDVYFFYNVYYECTHTAFSGSLARSIAPKHLRIGRTELDQNRTVYNLEQYAVPNNILNVLKEKVNDEDILAVNSNMFGV